MKHKKGWLILGIAAGFVCGFIAIYAGIENARNYGGVFLFAGVILENMGIQRLYRLSYEKEFPDLVHKEEIERQDERNRMIRFMAKAKSADIVQWLILAAAASIYFSDYPIWPVWVLLGVFTLRYAIEQYYMAKYKKEM